MNITAEELAKDPNTAIDILREIAKTNKDSVVLAAVAENPNADAELLIELFENCPYQVLNNPAIELILIEYPDLFERLDRATPVFESRQTTFNSFRLGCFQY